MVSTAHFSLPGAGELHSLSATPPPPPSLTSQLLPPTRPRAPLHCAEGHERHGPSVFLLHSLAFAEETAALLEKGPPSRGHASATPRQAGLLGGAPPAHVTAIFEGRLALERGEGGGSKES